nr:MAG TPA: hypothetical protein [Caudoviricetes sp.]
MLLVRRFAWIARFLSFFLSFLYKLSKSFFHLSFRIFRLTLTVQDFPQVFRCASHFCSKLSNFDVVNVKRSHNIACPLRKQIFSPFLF